MVTLLTQRLSKARTGLTEATEAIGALLQLQADGAHAAQGLDPVHLFVSTLVRTHARCACAANHRRARVAECCWARCGA